MCNSEITMDHKFQMRSVGAIKKKDTAAYIEVQRKSFGRLKGSWTPFNFIRKLIPGIHALQIHICGKT